MIDFGVLVTITSHHPRGGGGDGAGAELGFFVWGGQNFVTKILVSSQNKPSHSGINAHTQI